MFRAVVVLTQLLINAGKKLFQTGNCDPLYDDTKEYVNTAYDAKSEDEDEIDDGDLLSLRQW